MSHRVFVYGTLKRNFRNNHLLQRETFLGEAKTVNPSFKLYEVKSYNYPFPALVEVVDNGDQIEGELYEISAECLKRLDYLEGYSPDGGGLYDRKKITIQLSDGIIVENVWVYTFLGNVSKLTSAGVSWQL